MNYNILHGFHSDNQPFVLQEDRLKSAQEVVKRENPDILILTEACFADKNKYGIKMNYKKLFSFPHYFHTITGNEWNSALLSKYPINSSQDYCMDRRMFFRNELDVDGNKIYLDVAHPHPDLSEFERKRFFHSYLRDIPDKSYILTGDFNAISDQDKYYREKLIKGFLGFIKNKEVVDKVVDERLTHQAISEIRRHNLIDTYRKINKGVQQYTIPTDYLSLDKSSGMRVDYIFCSPDFEVEDARVIKNELTEKASDHYPVIAQLKLKISKTKNRK
jgi:endonuclease/exonuclease/phosphatase family metal-dependent hydrolase